MNMAHCHEENAAENSRTEYHGVGQMSCRRSGQKAAHHGSGAGSKKDGTEAVDTFMEHPVSKEGSIGAQI